VTKVEKAIDTLTSTSAREIAYARHLTILPAKKLHIEALSFGPISCGRTMPLSAEYHEVLF
jgi:hypothetical protein